MQISGNIYLHIVNGLGQQILFLVSFREFFICQLSCCDIAIAHTAPKITIVIPEQRSANMVDPAFAFIAGNNAIFYIAYTRRFIMNQMFVLFIQWSVFWVNNPRKQSWIRNEIIRTITCNAFARRGNIYDIPLWIYPLFAIIGPIYKRTKFLFAFT